MVLVKPKLWTDPREDPCAAFFVMGNGGIEHHISSYLSAAWAQCWSYEANSDVLLRAYSRVMLDPLIKRNTTPAEEGVRVTTTARRLIKAMQGWSEKHQDLHFYLAPMVYEPEQKFGQNLVNLLNGPDGPGHFRTPDGRANSLFVKRDRFSHENEVRLLCVGNVPSDEGPDVRRFTIDPNELFTEVSFDPRLIAFERKEREGKLVAHNFKGKIREDPSYSKVFTTIYVDKPNPSSGEDKAMGPPPPSVSGVLDQGPAPGSEPEPGSP